MVIVLFGQPNSGKTTLSECLKKHIDFVSIDGDNLRDVFKNKDFSKQGRLRNLERASDIATYLDSLRIHVVCSLVYPYKESRDYLRNLVPGSKWIFLNYEGQRGRENFHVDDFEIPDGEDVLSLNTSEINVDECVTKIIYFIHEKDPS